MKLVALFTLAALSAWAEDIAGKWKATADGPNGTMERTFDFKVEGSKLSGETVSSFAGKSTITEGKVTGNDLTFTIVVEIQGEKLNVTYKGTVSGGKIKLTSEAAGNTFEWTGQRM